MCGYPDVAAVPADVSTVAEVPAFAGVAVVVSVPADADVSAVPFFSAVSLFLQFSGDFVLLAFVLMLMSLC
jgi:hypothetical protein